MGTWDDRELTQGFASKVRSWTYNRPYSIDNIVGSVPSFCPQVITVSDTATWDESMHDETWETLRGLSSLKRVKIDMIESYMHMDGFPPNLEELTVKHLFLGCDQEGNLARLAGILSSVRS